MSEAPFTPAQEARIRELIAEAYLEQASLNLQRLHQVLELFRQPPPMRPARRSSGEGP